MKKQALKYISFVLVFVFVSVGVGFVVYNNMYPEVQITATVHYDYGKRAFVLGKLRVKKYSYDGDTSMSFTPKNEMQLIDTVTGSPYYVGEGSAYLRDWVKKDGYMLYNDNNMYLVHKTDENEYQIVNIHSAFRYNPLAEERFNINCTYPSPVMAEYCYYESGEIYSDKSELDYLYNYISYHQAKEFYEPFDEDYVIFDDENQVIRIKAYDSGEITENYAIILDFKNKDVGYSQVDGETIWASTFG